MLLTATPTDAAEPLAPSSQRLAPGLRRPRAPLKRALVVSFVGAGAAFILLLVAAMIGVRSAARSQALADARRLGEVSARSTIGPQVTDQVLVGDEDALANLDRVVRGLLAAGPATRVKVWDKSGRIVYSDVPDLIGRSFDLGEDDVALLVRGGVAASIARPDKPENQFERNTSGELLEVYVGVKTPNARPALVELYFPYSFVDETAADLRDHFMPLVVGGLALLALIQIPLAVSLAARLQRNQRNRERLLERVVSVSDAERRRIAAAVHDGAVQDLIGVRFSLDGASHEAHEPLDARLRELSTSMAQIIRQLRNLLQSIYPVQVPDAGLEEAIDDLVVQLREQGVNVHLRTGRLKDVSPQHELVMVRVARELLRNVATHAAASNVTVIASGSSTRVVLEVIDDGVGADPERMEERRTSGHFGLQLVHDLVADVGGDFVIEPRSGGGTIARLELEEP